MVTFSGFSFGISNAKMPIKIAYIIKSNLQSVKYNSAGILVFWHEIWTRDQIKEISFQWKIQKWRHGNKIWRQNMTRRWFYYDILQNIQNIFRDSRQLLFHLKLSEKLRFSDDFREKTLISLLKFA